MARIGRKYKSRILVEADIIEWCQEVECDIIGEVDDMYPYIGFPLDVVNSRAKLPCNVYRILDVYTTLRNDSSRVPFTRLKGYIGLDPDMDYTSVYIDYYGTPIDFETGIPLIQVGHEFACEAHCTYNMFLDDISNNKISQYFAEKLEAKQTGEILAACGSHRIRHKTRDQMNREQAIHYNMIPKPASFNLINGRY